MTWYHPSDPTQLADLFASLDSRLFHPHPLDAKAARDIVAYRGRDVFRVLEHDGELVAYGLLRGWDHGYIVPSLGVAVRSARQGRGFGREAVSRLHDDAIEAGSRQVRLRVHPDNERARRMYESMGYVVTGIDRGELVMVIDISSSR